MLAESKDLSELMVDLAYAALYFGDPDMAEEVDELEDRMSDLVHEMRAVSVLAARHPKEAEAMASVLQVISSIERIGNAAVDIARIVTHRLGIPRELVADLSNAEEVSHRVRIRDGSHLARRPLAAAPYWEPPVPPEDGTLSDLDRAVDVLVEMKNLSEAAVGLAYSALVLRDQGLAAEVRQLEDRLDEMKDRLELWVLRAGGDRIDPAPLRGLLHLSQAAEDLGDAAQQMVWLIEEKEELHPILSIALGDSDEVVVRVPVAAASEADGASLSDLQLDIEPGFHILAVQRGGRYLYRPRGHVRLEPGDELIASGPAEGHPLLAQRCGWHLEEDDDTGEHDLRPLRAANA